MSLLKTNQLQVGQSGTAAQNFTLTTGVDGTAKLARGNAGATTQDILTVDASGNLGSINGSTMQRMVLSTAKTASGTAIDFTGIPSWAKRVTAMYSGVSTNGTSRLVLQLGTSAGINTTADYSYCVTESGVYLNSTTGTSFFTSYTVYAASLHSGSVTLTNITGNSWVMTGNISVMNGGVQGWIINGTKTLPTALDRIRITTVNGTDTFDAGSVNILIEG